MRSTRCFVAVLVALSVASAACTDDGTNSDADPNGSFETATTVVDKPTVEIPAETPTELVITDLVAGAGRAAEVGDDVIVHYVGVLSADGQEFDSSFGGTPLEFVLGTGRVIRGWDQGLVGAQQGMRRQLDIPAELAYGDSPPGDGTGLIKAGAALSFVIDVVAVLPQSDAADEPQVDVAPAANITVLQSTDLVVGDGVSPQDGQNVAIQIITYRADTGELLASDWGGPPLTFAYSAQSTVFPGLLAVVKDMKVGGRRQSQVPFILMFDGQGSADFGLPPSIDVVVVVDLVAVY
ncbi:MAG: FKBP-type peptidyl-prolyl cis-trans isomerase [Actinomycetia bacterium]|nr:FKBP-type peptidyl-prolyl cis-trans isomerase [Actinomycetes bacterium]